MKLSIEFCRERTAETGAEEYLTEADGALSLVAFIAPQVDPALVERLTVRSMRRLRVEVSPSGVGQR